MGICRDLILCNANSPGLPNNGYFMVEAGQFSGDCAGAGYGSQATEVARRKTGGCLSCEGVGAPYSLTTTGADAAGTSRVVGTGCLTQQSCLTGADPWCALDSHCSVFSANPHRAALRKWQQGEDRWQLPDACPRTVACCRREDRYPHLGSADRCFDEPHAECLLHHEAGSRTIQGPYGLLTQTWEARTPGVAHPANTECSCAPSSFDPSHPSRYTKCLGQPSVSGPPGVGCTAVGACCNSGFCNVNRFEVCERVGGHWEGKPNCVGVSCDEACCYCGKCQNLSRQQCATLGGKNFPNKKCVDVALTDECKDTMPSCKDAFMIGMRKPENDDMIPVSRYPIHGVGPECQHQAAELRTNADGDMVLGMCNQPVPGERRIRPGTAEPLSVPQDDMAFHVRYRPACPF